MEYLIPDNYYRDDLDNREVMVSIHCIAYNQGKYIKETLDGFIAQKTNFRFEAIVHDDASTDNTADIIREYAEKYPSIIKPIFETENQYSKGDGSLSKIMYSHIRGKYVAYCEGDDYWIDQLKLQNQVDFLEKNPACSAVGSNYNKYDQETKEMHPNDELGSIQTITFYDLLLHNSLATLTMVIRANILGSYQTFIKNASVWSFGDYPLWLYATTKGDIIKFPERTAVYRILKKSASHMTNDKDRLRWAHSEFSMFDFFESQFKIPQLIKREALFNRCHSYSRIAVAMKDDDLINRIKRAYREGRFFIALLSFKFMLKSPKFHPIYNLIESHISIKAPMLYLRNKWDKDKF